MDIYLFIMGLALTIEVLILIWGRSEAYTLIRPYPWQRKTDPYLDEDIYVGRLPKSIMKKTGIEEGDTAEIIIYKNGDTIHKKLVLDICGETDGYYLNVNPALIDMVLEGKGKENIIPVIVRISSIPYIKTFLKNLIETTGILIFFTWLVSYIVNYEIFGLLVSMDRSIDILIHIMTDYKMLTTFTVFLLFIVILRNPYIDIIEVFKEPVKRVSQTLISIPKKYIEEKGDKPVLITVPHAKAPGGEDYIPQIAYKTARATGSHLLIGRVSRAELDLNRREAENHPFRRRIKKLVQKGDVKLIIDLHGMKGEEAIIEIGSSKGKCGKRETIELFKKYLEKNGFTVIVDKRFKGERGGTIISTYCRPPDIEALQIEVSHGIRRNTEMRRKFIEAMVQVVKKYCEIERLNNSSERL